MTDRDPAVEAVLRAYKARWPNLSYKDDDTEIRKDDPIDILTISVAREALAPIRTLHDWTCELGGGKCIQGPLCPIAICRECGGEWPCDTARLIYTADELAGEQS